MIMCKFSPYKWCDRDLFKCDKCGYIAKRNATRDCVPIVQTQYLNGCKPSEPAGEPVVTNHTPTLLGRLANFTLAFGQHLYKGMPTVSEEILDQRLKVCIECPLFKRNTNAAGGVCTHESCGCNIQDNVQFLNKLAWADQSCPLDKWQSTTEKVDKMESSGYNNLESFNAKEVPEP